MSHETTQYGNEKDCHTATNNSETMAETVNETAVINGENVAAKTNSKNEQ